MAAARARQGLRLRLSTKKSLGRLPRHPSLRIRVHKMDRRSPRAACYGKITAEPLEEARRKGRRAPVSSRLGRAWPGRAMWGNVPDRIQSSYCLVEVPKAYSAQAMEGAQVL